MIDLFHDEWYCYGVTISGWGDKRECSYEEWITAHIYDSLMEQAYEYLKNIYER